MAYVYRHIRLDKNEPFYIGIGKTKYRHSSKQMRNKIWHRIVKKTEYEVEIVINDISWEEAKIKEIFFIKLYGRIDRGTGILANMTDGGDGNLGLIHTPDGIERIRKSSKNRVGHWKGKKMSLEFCLNLSKSKMGKTHKGVPASQKAKDAVSKHATGNKYCVGRVISEETRRKISEKNKGKKSYNKGMPGLKGEKNGMFGKKHSEETRKKCRDVQVLRPVIQYDLDGNEIKRFDCIQDAARYYNIFATGIWACCKEYGRVKTYKKSKWKYNDNI